MFDQILPLRADNTYRGYKLALWLFAVVVFMKAAIGLNSIFNGHKVAISADGIPLDTFTPTGARAVVSLFALLGLSHLVICALCVLVLARYRSLVPFMFALLLVEYLVRRLILLFLPIPRIGTPPGSFVNLGLFVLMAVGLALSLWRRDNPQTRG